MHLKSLFGLLAFAVALLPVPTAADDANEIDLKLFGENVIQGWDGCRFALWQNNRDPSEDRYAYVFFAPIPDGEALPGWVKIGDDVIEISRLDIGSADTGMLEPFRLYRDPDARLTVMMEILEQTRTDDGIEVTDGRLTFLRNDKFPFAIRVKGLNGCPGAGADEAAMAPTSSGLSLGAPVGYDSLSAVPAPVLRAIAADAPQCEPQATAGYSSAYAINTEVTLWEVPCNLYAASGSSVFAVTWAGYPDHATILPFPAPPGMGMNDDAELLNASVDPASGSVTSYSLDSGGDCGSFSRFQLVDAEGETVEFVLREFREKTLCDGVQSDPAGFPLVYQNP
ncbi:DUF1176 domain-containing protein [Hoeflea alexandrii]|uniref:DUF1176 domain-containing protein n=1 Tax=Hoeflea alexandrii TaxID=288436 RepID=UPI00226FA060|nr:DUF1176 domain-containing protein [Hoeflea alexandrii]MCY0153701.1 DUF1176 domain-containing protein [Hoeflea alexandrii]